MARINVFTAATPNSMDKITRMWNLVLFMVATSLGYFVVQLDVSIVNLSLPAMQGYFHADVATLQWIVNAYTLSFSILLLSAGVLGDRYGNREFLILGYFLFLVGSLACGAAPTISFLLAARLFQGIGAALIVPNSVAVINWSFSDNKNLRLLMVSIWMSFGGIALTCGPIFGGIITSSASWRYIFFVNLPVCLIGILLTWRLIEIRRPRESRPQDWLGQGLLFLVATSLLVLIIDYTAIPIMARIALFAISSLGLGVFIAFERKFAYPAVPLSVFRNAGLQRAMIFGVLVNFIYFGIVFFSSLYFRITLKMTALEAGLAFIPITLPLILSNILGGWISRKHGPDRSIAVGFTFMIPGMLYLAFPELGTKYQLMLPAFALISFGVGFITPMIAGIALRAIGPEQGGMISAVINFFRQISGAFGVAIFGLFITNNSASYRDFGIALVVLAVALLLSIFSLSYRADREESAIPPVV